MNYLPFHLIHVYVQSSFSFLFYSGFAELQTDLDELTGDVAGCRLPYHHIRTYLMSMLFPGSTDSSMFQPLQVKGGQRRRRSLHGSW